jgi:hypothetical protein
MSSSREIRVYPTPQQGLLETAVAFISFLKASAKVTSHFLWFSQNKGSVVG